MPRWRFRLRTLMAVSAVVVLAAGGVRWWYDARLDEHDRQRRIVERLATTKTSILWSYVGPPQFERSKIFDERVFLRPTTARCDEVASDVFEKIVPQLGRLEIQKLLVLGRQIIPPAHAAKTGGRNQVIDALRSHSTLQQLFVDASIRGTPVEFDVPIYTREDLTLLEELLPGIEIVWIEAN